MPQRVAQVMQRLGHTNRVELSTTLRVDPRVVLASQLLQLGQIELEQAIETELNENPALERLEHDSEPVTDEQIMHAIAPGELRPRSEDAEYRRSLPVDDDLPDWIDMASSSPTLREHLSAQLLPLLPKELRGLGEFLVESVNDKGYLGCSIEEAALAAGASLEEAEAVIAALQACEPRGVGARNIQECLLLQLQGATTFEQKLARKIVKHCWDELVGHRIMPIARRYRVMPEVIRASFEVITALTPYPGEGFAPAGQNRISSRSYGVSPDLKLLREERGWIVEVLGPQPSSLQICRAYNRRMKQLDGKSGEAKDERRHLATQVQRASDFISCLEQRRLTMRRIGEYLVKVQTSFISTGQYQFLQPLTRSKMAHDLGVHESTISRATMDKFVQIANGEVVAFEIFFKPALRVQKMIEEILLTENPNTPLSDDAIAKLLAERGVTVARRTVNKYRDRTCLLSSRKRRSA